MNDAFRRFAAIASNATGTAGAFLLAFLVVFFWAITGPLFHFSDTWQLVINTSTTIITFLMVFLIQNTQNRDTKALHAKLDELIIATKGASNKMAVAEDLSDEELQELKVHFERVAKQRGAAKEGQPEVSGEPPGPKATVPRPTANRMPANRT